MVLNAVLQLDQTILEAFGRQQLQGHVTVTTCYQWNAVSNKDWDHADDELVDRVLIEKGGDQIAAAHQPDILAGLLSKTAYEWPNAAVHELNT